MKTLYVDASVFITLSSIDRHELLAELDGRVVVPRAVADEIADEPAANHLQEAAATWLSVPEARIRETHPEAYRHAASHLGRDPEAITLDGDVSLLAHGLLNRNGDDSASSAASTDAVIVTDDKPLREGCNALGISVSGSIGVLIAAVERDVLDAETAKGALLTMDEVGARLSASLLRRAERLIDDAAET